jgi:hypothetical protein
MDCGSGDIPLDHDGGEGASAESSTVSLVVTDGGT